MRLISTIIVSCLLVQTAFGECPNVVRLKVGDKVTDCERIGYSTTYDLGVRKDLMDADTNKKIIDVQTKMISVKDLAITDADSQKSLYREDAERERKVADDERSSGSTKFWVGLGVGFLAALAGAYIVRQTR